MASLSSVELCAGAGGQAIGLEAAEFHHEALFENDPNACQTLRLNRPNWRVHEHDLFENFDFESYRGVDLVAGGLPCPPFSIAGKQLGERDERNLFTRGVEIVARIRPRAVMFENVKGMLSPSFSGYRKFIEERLNDLGYIAKWELLNASNFGVPQLRPRVVMVALRSDDLKRFRWPSGSSDVQTVGKALFGHMSALGWRDAERWSQRANSVAPTIVGGSKKHGGPDLGPTRARAAWAQLGVNGSSIAVEPPRKDFVGSPRLTVPMVAKLQGFPDHWFIHGKKTAAYRQVGNAFPPPVAAAVARQIAMAFAAVSPVNSRRAAAAA